MAFTNAKMATAVVHSTMKTTQRPSDAASIGKFAEKLHNLQKCTLQSYSHQMLKLHRYGCSLQKESNVTSKMSCTTMSKIPPEYLLPNKNVKKNDIDECECENEPVDIDNISVIHNSVIGENNLRRIPSVLDVNAEEGPLYSTICFPSCSTPIHSRKSMDISKVCDIPYSVITLCDEDSEKDSLRYECTKDNKFRNGDQKCENSLPPKNGKNIAEHDQSCCIDESYFDSTLESAPVENNSRHIKAFKVHHQLDERAMDSISKSICKNIVLLFEKEGAQMHDKSEQTLGFDSLGLATPKPKEKYRKQNCMAKVETRPSPIGEICCDESVLHISTIDRNNMQLISDSDRTSFFTKPLIQHKPVSSTLKAGLSGKGTLRKVQLKHKFRHFLNSKDIKLLALI